ncbi:MAG TPA: LamG domain-containing protein, partial [Burkholderiaceae bacterium]|nr:LamG domain-containing protein [Burkholderiaceae bacterium]
MPLLSWLWLLLALLLPASAHAQCGAIPTANALTAGSGGSLSLSSDFTVNGVLASGSGVNLPTTGIRNNNATSFPAMVPASMPSFSSNNNVNSGPIAAGQYSNINLSGTQTFTGGTYYIANLNVTGSSTITLVSGTYYVNLMQLGNNVTVNTSGAVRLYIGSFFGAGNFLSFNAAGPTSNALVLLASNASVNISNNAAFRGVIYGASGNSVTFSNYASITGLIASASTVNLTTGSSITLSAADQAAIAGLSSCDPSTMGLVADYHFDECSYNGSSGEARDSRGSYHATSSGARPSTAAGGVVGRYLNSSALNTYLTTGSKVPMPGAYTVSVWYRTPFSIDNVGQYHVLGSLDFTAGSCQGDILFSDDRNAFRWGLYSAFSGITDGSQSINLPSGWHHVALVASGSSTQLYLDGSLRETLGQRINSDSSSYGLRYIGSSCDNLVQQSFRAPLDEFMVFNTALSATSISGIYNNQRAGKNWDGTARPLNSCTPAVASFTIGGTGAASTCAPQTITVTAKDAGGNTVTGYTGTVTLKSSSSLASWAKGSSPTPGGTLTLGPNPGEATYTFVSGDAGVAKFTLTQSAARDLN